MVQNQIKLPIDNYANKLIWYMETYLNKLQFDMQSFSVKANEKAKIGLKWFISQTTKTRDLVFIEIKMISEIRLGI